MSFVYDTLQKSGYTASNPTELGRGGALGLRDILKMYFLPELQHQQGSRGGIEDAFMKQTLEPGALFGGAKTAAEGYAKTLFAPGGEVASLIHQARGGAVSKGWAPEFAEGAERGILGAATGKVSDYFAQQAGALESERYRGLTGAYGDKQQAIRDLIESLFTGVSSSEQFGLARNPPTQKFLGIF